MSKRKFEYNISTFKWFLLQDLTLLTTVFPFEHMVKWFTDNNVALEKENIKSYMKISEKFCFTISEEWSERSSKFWVVRLTRAELPVGKKTFATSALSSVQKEFWAKFSGLWFMSSVKIDLGFKFKDEKFIYHLWFWQKSFMNLTYSLDLWNIEAKIFQVKKSTAYLYHQF